MDAVDRAARAADDMKRQFVNHEDAEQRQIYSDYKRRKNQLEKERDEAVNSLKTKQSECLEKMIATAKRKAMNKLRHDGLGGLVTVPIESLFSTRCGLRNYGLRKLYDAKSCGLEWLDVLVAGAEHVYENDETATYGMENIKNDAASLLRKHLGDCRRILGVFDIDYEDGRCRYHFYPCVSAHEYEHMVNAAKSEAAVIMTSGIEHGKGCSIDRGKTPYGKLLRLYYYHLLFSLVNCGIQLTYSDFITGSRLYRKYYDSSRKVTLLGVPVFCFDKRPVCDIFTRSIRIDKDANGEQLESYFKKELSSHMNRCDWGSFRLLQEQCFVPCNSANYCQSNYYKDAHEDEVLAQAIETGRLFIDGRRIHNLDKAEELLTSRFAYSWHVVPMHCGLENTVVIFSERMPKME